ncbi:MAG: hypothetical protein DLM70_06220 [Chloroflexi bacterium]|nr:MAG: hypothetical protein DLM70_06220 [Chloroflexota bacterium]
MKALASAPSPVAETAALDHAHPPRPPRQRGSRIHVPAQIRAIVEQVSEEFHDAPDLLLSNLARAMNLYRASGLSEYEYCRILQDARAATKRAGTITKPSTQPGTQGTKNKVPYWFATVEKGHERHVHARGSRGGTGSQYLGLIRKSQPTDAALSQLKSQLPHHTRCVITLEQVQLPVIVSPGERLKPLAENVPDFPPFDSWTRTLDEPRVLKKCKGGMTSNDNCAPVPI